eukprot:2690768-Ditylum_brightwellii.AAC.1
MRDYGFGHLDLSDVGRNWGCMDNDDRPLACFRCHSHRGKLAMTTAHNIHDKISGKYQVGGTASITMGNMVGRLDRKGSRDPSGLGCYTWHKLRGEGGLVLRILTFYRPCKSANSAALVSVQHISHFSTIGRLQCPRNALMDNLKRHIQTWKEEGDQVVVMHLDMRELISKRHGGKGPAATRSNKSGQAIDRIWATLG